MSQANENNCCPLTNCFFHKCRNHPFQIGSESSLVSTTSKFCIGGVEPQSPSQPNAITRAILFLQHHSIHPFCCCWSAWYVHRLDNKRFDHLGDSEASYNSFQRTKRPFWVTQSKVVWNLCAFLCWPDYTKFSIEARSFGITSCALISSHTHKRRKNHLPAFQFTFPCSFSLPNLCVLLLQHQFEIGKCGSQYH